jgi:hypothetical protein
MKWRWFWLGVEASGDFVAQLQPQEPAKGHVR